MGTITKVQKKLKDASDNQREAWIMLEALRIALKNQPPKKEKKNVESLMRELMYVCKKQDMCGKNTHIDGHYVSFEFRKLKEKCKCCGREKIIKGDLLKW